MKKINWQCEHCNKEFTSKKECEKHEKKCKDLPKKIFVNKGIKFLRAGAVLFFGQIGLNLFFKPNFISPLFLYVGIGLIFIGFIIFLSGAKEIKWVCPNCKKEFLKKEDCIIHNKNCK